MTSSRISYHVHATFTPDRQRLIDHMAKVRPHFVLVSGPVELAREVQTASPTTNVIWREGGDRYAYQQRTPEEWLSLRSGQAPGMTLYTSDETPLDAQAIDWHSRLMDLAADQGVKLCVMNFGAGQPQPDDWSRIRPIIDRLNAHRDLFVMGLREYAAGVITSGVGGGEPTLIQPSAWPSSVDGTDLWHMGRYTHLLSYCVSQNIPVPRLVVTHHGFERMNDLAGWLDGLNKTPPFNEVRGWKSLELQWMSDDWFGGVYESAQQAYFEQLKWANDVLYAPLGAVEGQMVYSWGAAGNEEQTLDISQAFDFQAALETYAATQPDYTGFSGTSEHSAEAALSDEDRATIIAGFEAALDAGFLDHSTADSLRRWLDALRD